MGLFLLNYPASTNALFNKKNVENDNSKNKKNELATQVQVERQKFIEDASTGTITELHPGMEKKPVTCNEIMAKAVVEANEQRSEALMDRDLALKEARDANKSKDKYEKDMNSAIEAKKKMEAQVKVIKKMLQTGLKLVAPRQKIKSKKQMNQLQLLFKQQKKTQIKLLRRLKVTPTVKLLRLRQKQRRILRM